MLVYRLWHANNLNYREVSSALWIVFSGDNVVDCSIHQKCPFVCSGQSWVWRCLESRVTRQHPGDGGRVSSGEVIMGPMNVLLGWGLTFPWGVIHRQSSLYGWMDGFLSASLPVVSNLVLLMKGSIHSIEMLILIPVIIIIWMDLFVNNISGVSLSL